jgi:FAD:protein FMN transferase
MGTRFELAMVDDGRVDVEAIGELALREIEDWHARLSRFEPDSWLSHVNRTAASEPIRLDDETWPLFADAVQVWRDSSGAFDIARGGRADLELNHQARTLSHRHDGVSLDLGAIGKGHALDRAAAILRSHGVTRALIQGGTSSGVAIGRPLESSAWRIGVATTQGAATVDEVLELVDESFSLSDEASQPFAPGGRHIVDPRRTEDPTNITQDPGPRTRRVVPSPRRVIVTGPSARLADAWSTALVVLGEVPPAFPAGYRARFLRK